MVKELVEITGGELISGSLKEKRACNNLSVDSRQIDKNTLFVPLAGEKRDGHDFFQQVYEAGGRFALSARRACFQAPDFQIIFVEDTLEAMQKLAKAIREGLGIPLIGITGSVGKTTTREMVAAALGAEKEVFKTPANFNSQVGVPLTLSSIAQEDIGIIEMGISEFGEMTRLSKMVQPDLAVVTNIGEAHLKQLITKENIRDQKFHIQDHMAPGGILLLNGEDPILRESHAYEEIQKEYFNCQGENCTCYAAEIDIQEGLPVFTAHIRGESLRVKLGVCGIHQISNALAALAVAWHYGVDLQKAAKSLEEFKGFPHRQQIRCTGKVTVIDDTYNASPDSMRAALQILTDMPQGNRKIAVLGDMKELGRGEIKIHRAMGSYIKGLPIDYVITLGKLGAELLHCLPPGKGKAFMDSEKLAAFLQKYQKPGDVILFKASNSMGLTQVVDSFVGE